jgi:hypothetical protein
MRDERLYSEIFLKFSADYKRMKGVKSKLNFEKFKDKNYFKKKFWKFGKLNLLWKIKFTANYFFKKHLFFKLLISKNRSINPEYFLNKIRTTEKFSLL